AEIMYRANNTLCEGNDAGMFVTVWLGILDLSTGIMQCANAGHEYPFLMRAGGDFELFKDKHGLALAAMEGLRYKEYELQLNPGDRLFVYTDGVPEAINEKVDQYGTDRMAEILNRVKHEKICDMLPAVRQSVADFAGTAEQFDDITMLSITYFGKH
ncbi:MAG: serine/threonine-protein phosphatase, partial [Clostridia bacterium]|nr:serine/threonine-protein phosphatase [Clostridia bacterium]